jgi:hypothetical protein
MKIDYKKASKLCSADEFRLVEQSRPNNVAQLNLRDAKRRVEQARKQFDKWRQLSITQDRHQRGKPSDQAQERTQAKRDLFREVLNRFEARQKKIEAIEAGKERRKSAAKKPAAGAQKPPFAAKPAKASPAKGKGSRTSGSTAPGRAQLAKGKGRVTKHKITQSGLTTRVKGHVSARGRRAQARRNVR